MKNFIYELIDPETKEPRYIGKTNNPSNRLKKHLNECNKVDIYTPKNKWLSYLKDKGLTPIMNIIEETENDNINELEIEYIKNYREKYPNLTNATDGGDGYDWTGRKHEVESVKRMKYNHPKRRIILQFDMKNNFIQKFDSSKELDKHPIFSRRSVVRCCKDEVYDYMGYYFRYSDEFFESANGKKITNMEEIQKILDSNQVEKIPTKRKQATIDKKEKIKEKRIKNFKPKKIYIQYDLEGNILGKYNGIMEASKLSGCHTQLISNCCKNKSYYTVNNTTFRYEGDIFDYTPYNKNIQKTSRKICKYKLNGEFVCEFDSIKMACIEAGISKNGANISRCCHKKYNQKTGKSIIVKGFTYRFSEETFKFYHTKNTGN